MAFFDADTLCHTETLTFACLPWKFVVYQTSRDQSLYKIWAKSSNSRLNYWSFCEYLHVISCC